MMGHVGIVLFDVEMVTRKRSFSVWLSLRGINRVAKSKLIA